MKISMREKLSQLVIRLQGIENLLHDPSVTDDIDQYRKLMKEQAEIMPVVERYQTYLKCESNIASALEMMSDPDLKEFAQEEYVQSKDELEQIAQSLQAMLLPKDENDERNIILEIRAGTGGEESALFAGDLLRMYSRFAERQGWKVELLSESASALGGYREVIMSLAGTDVYGQMKFESGGHRVQRVPETEAQGRIHTSACTVAVMPEADEIEETLINPSDLRVDTYRASGAGGQHINKTDSAVRITHLPTGTVVECQDERSQHRNRAKAMKILASRLRDAQIQSQQKDQAQTRKSLVGSGDRSERIRTYNFPQGRISDHRVNLTWYKIEAMMDGDLSEMVKALQSEHQVLLLGQLNEDDS